ncbi:single-stranded DNA-binding protein [Marinigracilibium pacificum]|uniref:Single-stranded DNA-binding protein n=1 Tax=Marinigracilibium pacificum TaxID=2729599 RepID=A0A848J1I5_9BACT|nr:single-stranded DNA-binding protein [Marinigracilibium pacificum]NMM47082.1 single-stranded DNA-binding protein [Marinigracilibium pacificum]
MSGVNKVILVGNLGKDPEVRHLESGRAVANFPLATSEVYKDRRTNERVTNTEWHNVVLWSPLAEIAERFLKKGSQVYIEGKITTRSYDDKEGIKRYITEIVGRELTLLGTRDDNGGSGMGQSNSTQSTSQGSSSSNYSNEAVSIDNNDSGDEMDDLPF